MAERYFLTQADVNISSIIEGDTVLVVVDGFIPAIFELVRAGKQVFVGGNPIFLEGIKIWTGEKVDAIVTDGSEPPNLPVVVYQVGILGDDVQGQILSKYEDGSFIAISSQETCDECPEL